MSDNNEIAEKRRRASSSSVIQSSYPTPADHHHNHHHGCSVLEGKDTASNHFVNNPSSIHFPTTTPKSLKPALATSSLHPTSPTPPLVKFQRSKSSCRRNSSFGENCSNHQNHLRRTLASSVSVDCSEKSSFAASADSAAFASNRRKSFSLLKSFNNLIMKGGRSSCCHLRCTSLFEIWLKRMEPFENVWESFYSQSQDSPSSSSNPFTVLKHQHKISPKSSSSPLQSNFTTDEKKIIAGILCEMTSSKISIKCSLDHLLHLFSLFNSHPISSAESSSPPDNTVAGKRQLLNWMFLLHESGSFVRFFKLCSPESIKVSEAISSICSSSSALNIGGAASNMASMIMKTSFEYSGQRSQEKSWPNQTEMWKFCDRFELSFLDAVSVASSAFWLQFPERLQIQILDMILALLSRKQKVYMSHSNESNSVSIVSITLICSSLKALGLFEGGLAPSFSVLLRLVVIVSNFVSEYMESKKSFCDAVIVDDLMLILTVLTKFALKFYGVFVFGGSQKPGLVGTIGSVDKIGLNGGKINSKLWPSFMDNLFSALENLHTLNLLDNNPFIPQENQPTSGPSSIFASFIRYERYSENRRRWISNCIDICLSLLDLSCSSMVPSTLVGSSTSFEVLKTSTEDGSIQLSSPNLKDHSLKGIQGRSLAIKLCYWVSMALDSIDWTFKPYRTVASDSKEFCIKEAFSLDYPNLADSLLEDLNEVPEDNTSFAFFIFAFIKLDMTTILKKQKQDGSIASGNNSASFSSLQEGLQSAGSETSNTSSSFLKISTSTAKFLSAKLKNQDKRKNEKQYMKVLVQFVSLASSCLLALEKPTVDPELYGGKSLSSMLVKCFLWPTYLMLQDGIIKGGSSTSVYSVYHLFFGKNIELLQKVSFIMACLLSTGHVATEDVWVHLENQETWFQPLFCPLFRNMTDFMVLSRRRPKHFRNRFMNMPSVFHRKTVKLRYCSEYCSSEILFLEFMDRWMDENLLARSAGNIRDACNGENQGAADNNGDVLEIISLDGKASSAGSPSSESKNSLNRRDMLMETVQNITGLLAIDAAMYVVCDFMIRQSIALKKRIPSPSSKVPFAVSSFSKAIGILLRLNEMQTAGTLAGTAAVVPSVDLSCFFDRIAAVIKPCALEMLELNDLEIQEGFTKVPPFLITYLSLILETSFPSSLASDSECIGFNDASSSKKTLFFLSSSNNGNGGTGTVLGSSGFQDSSSGSENQVNGKSTSQPMMYHFHPSEAAVIDQQLFPLLHTIFRALNVQFPKTFTKHVSNSSTPIFQLRCTQRRRILRYDYCHSVVKGGFFADSMDMAARQIDRIMELMVALMAKESWPEDKDGLLRLLLAYWNRVLRSPEGVSVRKKRYTSESHFSDLKEAFERLRQKYHGLMAYFEDINARLDEFDQDSLVHEGAVLHSSRSYRDFETPLHTTFDDDDDEDEDGEGFVKSEFSLNGWLGESDDDDEDDFES